MAAFDLQDDSQIVLVVEEVNSADPYSTVLARLQGESRPEEETWGFIAKDKTNGEILAHCPYRDSHSDEPGETLMRFIGAMVLSGTIVRPL